MVDAKCSKCKSTTENTYAIQCCKCNKWTHTKCISMSKATLNSYEKELKNQNGKRWFCQPCEPRTEKVKRPSLGTTSSPNPVKVSEGSSGYTLNDVMKKLENIDDKYTILLEKYEEQIAINHKLRVELDELKHRVDGLHQQKYQEKTNNQNNTNDALEEIREREHRKRNLVVYGVEEMNSEEPEERKCHDVNIIKKLLESQRVEVETNNIKVYRIGRRENGKVRPVRVILNSFEEVKKVFLKAKDIKKTTKYSGLSFSSDRTKQEQNEYQAKKEELKNRMEKGEKDLKIKYVKGKPQILKIKN